MAEPTAENRAPASRRWLKLLSGAFMYVYIFGLPGLQVLTTQTSQVYFHFSMASYLEYLLVVLLYSLPVAGLLYLAWRPAGRLAPLQRLFVALLLTLPLPVYLQMIASKLEWHGLHAGLENRYALLVWLLLLLPGLAGERVTRALRKAAVVVAKVLAPLPFVMGLFLLSTPSVPSVREPTPAALAQSKEGAPVYILLFDALDRERIFAKDNAERFPRLFALRDQSVWFDNSKSYGYGTVNIVPCLLHQQQAEVSRDDNGRYLLDDTPSSELDSIFARLGAEGSLRVVGGFHLNYSMLLEGETDWLREYSYYNWNDGALPLLRTHTQLLLANMYLPSNPPVQALKALAQVDAFPHDAAAHILAELEAQLMACAGSPNHDLVAFFHLPVPHNPFIFDRDGRRLRVPDTREPDDEGYLKNVEYVDAMLDRFVDSLKASGQWDDCTLVVTGDHGKAYTEVPPLMVRLPGQSSGRVVTGELYSTGLLDWLERQPEYIAR